MNKTKNSTSNNRLPKAVTLLRAVLLVAISVAMVISAPALKVAVGNELASNCPTYTEYGSCALEHGLRAGIGATIASGVWLLAAAAILATGVRSIHRYIKSNR